MRLASSSVKSFIVLALTLAPGYTPSAEDSNRSVTPPRTPLLEEFSITGTSPLDIDDFVARPRVDSVVLSPQGTMLVVGHMARSTENSSRTPNGRRITYPSINGLKPQLSLFFFPSLQSIRSRQINRHLVGHVDIRWLSERRLLIQLDVPQRGFDLLREYSGGIGIADVGGNTLMQIRYDPLGLIRRVTPIDLRPYMAEIRTDAEGPLRVVEARTGVPTRVLIQTTRSDSDGKRAAFGAFGVFELDATNGVLTRVASLPASDGQVIVGPNHGVAVVSAVGARRERLIYFLPPTMRANERSSPRLANWQLRVTSDVDYGLQPIAWTGDGENYYALDGRGTPTRAVVVWNAESNTVRSLYRHPDVDIEGFSLDPTGKPWMFSGTNHYPLYWYPDPDHPLARLHRALTQRMPEEQIELLSATDDFSYVVARIGSARRPPVFAVLDAKSMQTLTTFPTYPNLDGRRLAPVVPIEYRARDGLAIRGYLTTPLDGDGHARREAPLVVIAHDGPMETTSYNANTVPAGTFSNAPAGYNYEVERQLFASRGYAVLQVNTRGSRGRGRDFEIAGSGGAWAREAQDDIIDGVHWAVTDGAADATRVCFYGTGHGARSALAAASHAPSLFKCVVGVNGNYDESIISNAASIKAAVLLMQQSEAGIPTGEGSRMRSALQAAGNPARWESIYSSYSGVLTPDNRAAAYTTIFAFLEKQLAR